MSYCQRSMDFSCTLHETPSVTLQRAFEFKPVETAAFQRTEGICEACLPPVNPNETSESGLLGALVRVINTFSGPLSNGGYFSIGVSHRMIRPDVLTAECWTPRLIPLIWSSTMRGKHVKLMYSTIRIITKTFLTFIRYLKLHIICLTTYAPIHLTNFRHVKSHQSIPGVPAQGWKLQEFFRQ